jgi:hypothetical protein
MTRYKNIVWTGLLVDALATPAHAVSADPPRSYGEVLKTRSSRTDGNCAIVARIKKTDLKELKEDRREFRQDRKSGARDLAFGPEGLSP